MGISFSINEKLVELEVPRRKCRLEEILEKGYFSFLKYFLREDNMYIESFVSIQPR